MQFFSGINEIIDSYEYFILDIWGVIHDGSAPYPGVVEALSLLRAKNKKVCFLSNAPRRARKVSVILEKFNITPDLYDFIITSGETTYLTLEKNQKNGFKDFGKNYFYIGPKKDIDLLDGLDYKMVDLASEANFALTTGFDNDDSTISEKLPHILEAKKFDLPLICVNPDLIVVKQDGRELICAGALAHEYEKIAGKVVYFGKPFDFVYKMVCEIFNDVQNDSSISDFRRKIVAIGDGLETDIKGASDFGIDSVLVTGGILANNLGINYTQSAEKSKLEAICEKYQLFPKFVIPSFKL